MYTYVEIVILSELISDHMKIANSQVLKEELVIMLCAIYL